MDKVVINQLPVEKLRGRRVFVRIDADSELSGPGVLFDESKLRSSLPTLEYLMGVGARTVIGASLGKPGGRVVESLRLDPVAERLSRMLGGPVRKLGEAIGRGPQGAVAGMQDGDLLLLENLRFYPGEDANDADFAHELAQRRPPSPLQRAGYSQSRPAKADTGRRSDSATSSVRRSPR